MDGCMDGWMDVSQTEVENSSKSCVFPSSVRFSEREMYEELCVLYVLLVEGGAD